MKPLSIQLLGDFRIWHDDFDSEAVHSLRLQSLIAYLVLHRHKPQPRGRLAYLFWPDTTVSQARTNLRQLLHTLRRCLPFADRYLSVSSKTLQWRSDMLISLDMEQFIKSSEQMNLLNRANLEKAANLYRGDLLPDCLDEWIIPEREMLRNTFIQLLEKLTEMLEIQRDYDAAIHYSQRLLRQDPIHETTYRRLMRLYTQSGDRVRALRTYHACTTVLQKEFDVEPDAATQQLYESLLEIKPSPISKSVLKKTKTPFVGREEEWKTICSIWLQAAAGKPRLAVIKGEAGIGKTRLAEELQHWVEEQGMVSITTRVYATEGSLAFAPIADWLRSERLRMKWMEMDDVWLAEMALLLPEQVLTKPLSKPAPPISEGLQRIRLFEAVARAILSLNRPLLLILDDLQWCDSETLEFLHYLIRFDLEARLLIVGTVRPEEVETDHPLMNLSRELLRSNQITEIALTPLNAAETAILAERWASSPLEALKAEQLFKETEGYPLFIEEIMREGFPENLLDTSLSSEKQTFLPPKVNAVIESRFSLLSKSAQDLLSLAACIGRQFTFDVLLQASDEDETLLVQAIDELWHRRIVNERGPDAYDFSHDKIRETAYARISLLRQRMLHRRVAQSLQIIYASNLESVSGEIAAHYVQSGRPEQAIPFYQLAATTAQRIFANQEAIALLKKGILLLQSLPETSDRMEQELSLQTSIGVPLVAIDGYGASSVIEVYEQALSLCYKLNKPPDPPVLRALAIAYLVKGELQRSYELGKQLLSIAENDRNSVLLLESHYVLGVTMFWMGEFTSAREQLEQAMDHYDTEHHSYHLSFYSQDPGVVCRIRLAYLLWYMGYADQAVKHCQDALHLAEKGAHPFSKAYALNFAAWLYNDLQDIEMMKMMSTEAYELSMTHNLGFLHPMGTILTGWEWVQRGDLKAGIAKIQTGVDTYHAMNQNLYRPYALSLLARSYALTGRNEEALVAIDDALTMSNETKETFLDAELCRLKGETLLRKSHKNAPAASSLFIQALHISRSQQAKMLELRAALSLGNLRKSQGTLEEKIEALKALNSIYDWFTEGFSIIDFSELKSLLEYLKQ